MSRIFLVLLIASCAQPPASSPPNPAAKDAGIDEEGGGRIKKKRDPDLERRVRALSAEVEALKSGAPAPYKIVDAHEHLRALGDLEKYLPAARRAGIVKTIVVASPVFTLDGKGHQGEPSMSENFAVLLQAAAQYPDEIVPFFTLDPGDPDKLARAQRHVAAGGKGLKLYSGHTNFYKEPLDKPDMDPVYAWLEETGLPIVWHINLEKWLDDFERVMAKHPRLNVMVPHYGVLFWKTAPDKIERFKKLLRTHPRMYFDTSLGTREILIDGLEAMSGKKDVWRALIQEFPDRVLFGTDAVITGNREKTPTWFLKVMTATRAQLEKESFSTELAAAYSRYGEPEMDPDGTFDGLALDPAVLKKIYEENPLRWLAGGPVAQ